jgi:hypothetical protein
VTPEPCAFYSRTFASDWFFKVHAPFWSESFRDIGRTVDLAGRRHTIHFSVAPARVCFRCCEFGCWRQVLRNDLLGLAGPALSTDSGAALFDGDEATIGAAAAVIDSTPFIGISTARAGREKHCCGSHGNHHQYSEARVRGERPRGRSAANKSDELAPSHCLPQAQDMHRTSLPPAACQRFYTAAIASISSRKFGFASPRSTQSVLAGGSPPKWSCRIERAFGTSCGLQM